MAERIGWIGLGAMGMPMAANVARAGFPLTVFDLRPEPVRTLVGLGAGAADSAADVGARCDLLFVSLPGPAASEAVASEVLAAASRPAVYAELSTLAPATVKDLAARAAAAGIGFIDAPVSGGPQQRTDGTLSVMVGGDDATLDRARPVLDTIGSNLFHLGPVGTGCVAKLANNLIALTALVTAAEGLLLGVRGGLDSDQLRDVVMASSGGNLMVLAAAHFYAVRHESRHEPSLAAIGIAVKDLELAVQLAAEVGLPVRTARAALDAWRDAAGAGLSDAEMSALVTHLDAMHV